MCLSLLSEIKGISGRPATGRADLHVHTSASDGVSDVRAVLEAARDCGLDVVAISDHNTIVKAQEAQGFASEYGVEVVVAEEISTSQGHCLAYFLSEPVRKGQTLAQTIAAVHAQGGIAVIAHPYDPISFGVLNPWRHKITATELMALDFDAMEVYNACLVRGSANAKACALAAERDCAIVAGSDAHSAATVGLAATEFPGRTAEDLRQAMLQHTTVPTGRPWTPRQYLSLFGRRELRYAGVAASYALGLATTTALAAALALRSGITRILD
ncbi:MAG: CehA/McbA family metallohydrolase [Anaerolineae bacterium]